MPSETRDGWGVLIRCKDGREFLAHSGEVPPHVFKKREQAFEHIDELVKHRFRRRSLKAVRVRITAEWESKDV